METDDFYVKLPELDFRLTTKADPKLTGKMSVLEEFLLKMEIFRCQAC